MYREPILRSLFSSMLLVLLAVLIVDTVEASRKPSASITVPAPANEAALSVKVNSDLVQIPVTVTDKADQAVEHLIKRSSWFMKMACNKRSRILNREKHRFQHVWFSIPAEA